MSHNSGGVGPKPGTKPVGRSDLAHPLITDTDPRGGQNKHIASSWVMSLYQSLSLLGIEIGWGGER